MAAVRAGRTRFVPQRFEKTFFDWLENIHDWNVGRQLWWGHRIPAWYCVDGHVTVSDDPAGPPACAACARPASELAQDEEIFDTWFSAGLWPFSTLGWPDDTDELRRYYPTTVMETGYDIIFFWVARMMMLGEWLTGREPFATVYLHGMVRDPYGAKMSKTKGNVVDPLGVIAEVGADALRFALINGTAPGADQRLGDSRLEGARTFANKLWNAARFVLGARPAEFAANEPLALPPSELLGPAEHWILGRCAANTAAVEAAYAAFQLGEATRLLHEALWNEYCDWYLELAKVSLGAAAASAERRAATWRVLVWVLDRYLRLLHPVMPFVTEAIWGRLPHLPDDPELLIVARWPAGAVEAALADPARAAGTNELIELVGQMRAARAEAGIDAGEWLEARLWLPDGPVRVAYAELAEQVGRLARVRPTLVGSLAELDEPAGSATLAAIAGAAEARLLRSGADLERDRARLARELERARAALSQTEARLADASFSARAPAEVVDSTRRRADELRELVARLSARMST
jgi:valyl-tRNA synthetase